MTEKEIYIENMKKWTWNFTVETLQLCDSLKKDQAANVITYQLLRAASSSGVNYRAACKTRSKVALFSKISIVVEEADESEYRLEVIQEAKLTEKVKGGIYYLKQ